MQKKYVVRLSDAERETLRDVIRRLKGSSQKVRRAQILLKADVDGPAWTDQRDSAEARRLGISRTEYYTHQHRAATLCDVAGATAASARERVRCRYDVLEGRR